MLKAKCSLNKKVYFPWRIKDYKFIKENKPHFICPNCNSEVNFVDGVEVVKHFRHKTLNECSWEPESEEHVEMKMYMKDFFKLNDDEVEVNIGFATPDLLIKDQGIAIEVQKSNISQKKFRDRTYNYTKNHLAVLWVFHESLLTTSKSKKNSEGYEINGLLRTAHKNNFGRVYIYSDKQIYAIHFKAASRYIPEYYNKDEGVLCGGYLKEYKKKKHIQFGEKITKPKLYKVNTAYCGNKPAGYYIAKFFDVNYFLEEPYED